MSSKFINRNPISFVHLHALSQKEARLNADRFRQTQLIAAIIDLGNEVFHLETMEWSDAHHHLVEHHTQGPSVHFGAVPAFLEELGT